MHDGPLHRLVEPSDRPLGRVDDGCRGDAAELAEAGHGDRGPDEFIARRLAAARALGETADFSGYVPEPQRLRIAHHWNLHTIPGLCGDADMHRAVAHQHPA